MKTLEALNTARELHSRLVCDPNLSVEKPGLAREIAGQLFVVEAQSNLDLKWRALLSRLKTDAHDRSQISDSASNFDALANSYDELEQALGLTSLKAA